jgi:hypothetical protein
MSIPPQFYSNYIHVFSLKACSRGAKVLLLKIANNTFSVKSQFPDVFLICNLLGHDFLGRLNRTVCTILYKNLSFSEKSLQLWPVPYKEDDFNGDQPDASDLGPGENQTDVG